MQHKLAHEYNYYNGVQLRPENDPIDIDNPSPPPQ